MELTSRPKANGRPQGDGQQDGCRWVGKDRMRYGEGWDVSRHGGQAEFSQTDLDDSGIQLKGWKRPRASNVDDS